MAKSARQLDREIAEAQVRAHLTRRVQKLLDKWQPILGVRVAEFRIKKMRAFGAQNLPAKRLWISQALASMTPADLEYVVVHELMHLRLNDPEGSGHDARFYALMDRFLPNWRSRHAQLRSDDGIIARDLPDL